MVLNEQVVFGEVADDGMLTLETDRKLIGRRGLEQRAHITQPPRSSGDGAFACLVEGSKRMAFRQACQSHEGAYSKRSFAFENARGPLAARFSERLNALPPIRDLAIERALPASQPETLAELSGFEPPVKGNLFPALVEDAHLARVPSCPDRSLDVLGRDGVVRALHFDVAVAVNRAPPFMENGEQASGQRQQ